MTATQIPSLNRKGQLGTAMLFLIIAIVAGLLGFGLIAGLSYVIAKVLFFIFIILFIFYLIRHLVN